MLKPAGLFLRGAERCLPLTRHVPFMLQRLALEKSLNRLFAEPLADGAFDILRGCWLRLQVRDLNLAWYLTRTDSGLQVAERRWPRSASAAIGATSCCWPAARKTRIPCFSAVAW